MSRRESIYTKADNLAALKYFEFFMCKNFYFKTRSIKDYVKRRPVTTSRKIGYYLNLALHLAYAVRWAILSRYHQDSILAWSGEFLHHYFKIKIISITLWFWAMLYLNQLVVALLFESRHNVKYLDILHKIRTKNNDYR